MAIPGLIGPPEGGFGTRKDYSVPPELAAKLAAMNSVARGTASPVETAPASPVTAPSSAAGASANLREIFAPAASQPTSSAPMVSTSAPSGTAPVGVAAPVAPAAPSSPGMMAASGGGRRAGNNIDGWLKELMSRLLYDGGMGADLKMDLRNQATNVGKLRERDRILRRADDFAARGLFGSGLSKRGVQGIEAEESQNLQTALNEIEFQDAQMKAQSLRDAIQAVQAQIQWKLGKGQLNVQREQIALQKLMHAEQMALSWAQFNWQKLMDQAGDPGYGGTNPVNSNARVDDTPRYGSGSRFGGGITY